ncbi:MULTISPECIES: DUF2969 family protein [Desemzia]|uniref:DUF2969 domain-containing protein n=1 Tax=Desemzia incerta TaxID=82801 RepID=A0A1I5XT33_9LACT|nr:MULTISPECIES: DUF2969 family protein [Desemzia]SFQ35070.1 Protein of unknown function [Desemzia incerta]
MSKRNKKSEVMIKETNRNSEDFTELELFVGNEKIGTIQQEKEQAITTINKNGNQAKAKNIDEAINNLIMDYNLHYM